MGLKGRSCVNTLPSLPKGEESFLDFSWGQRAWSPEESKKLINQMDKASFRFEGLDIWKLAIEINNELFDISDLLISEKKFKFAEQLDSASMSISNNIAEGSGSFSSKDFANFLNISRRSVFECSNILIILLMRNFIDQKTKDDLFQKLYHLSKMITNFRKALLK